MSGEWKQKANAKKNQCMNMSVWFSKENDPLTDPSENVLLERFYFLNKIQQDYEKEYLMENQ